MLVKHSHLLESTPVANGSGVSKTVLISAEQGPNFAMRKFTIEPGGSMPYHTNLVEHEQFVLQGEALIVLGEEEFQVKYGDVIFIPADLPHSYTNVGEGPFEFLCLIPNKPDKTVIV